MGDLISDFAAGFGSPRINVIQSLKDYWNDFMNEIKFIGECEGNPVKVDGYWYAYKLPKNFAELQANMQHNEQEKVGESKIYPFLISLICSIEGLHILNCGLERACDPEEVKANARALKKLPNAPWFVTFAHHFYNELCGHARSLKKQIGKMTDQEKGINSGFTLLGEEVLDILLDNDPSKGKRILVDVKHMSPLSRNRFYELRQTKYNSSIPIFMSNGVCNGLPFYGATVSNFPEFGKKFINPVENDIGGDLEPKNHNYINFYDDEILEMVRSDGIIGIQLDERRLANEEALSEVKNSLFRNKMMHYRSELVWRQVQYIAELLDGHGLFAWGNVAIGSDFDGLVDPLNSFWTAEEFDDLAGYLERHAYNYFGKQPERMTQAFNKLTADAVIQRIFHDNAWEFLQKWF